jgi:arylsulfatase A-like enzyme
MALRFRKQGYQTAFIGKAHLPLSWVKEGFEYIRLCDLCDADLNDPRSCHYFNDLVEAGLADSYDQGVLPPEHRGYKASSFISNLPEAYSPESWTGREACKLFDQLDADRPFFAQISFLRPHDPYAPPPERADEYKLTEIKLPSGSEDYLQRMFEGKPAFQQAYVRQPKGVGYPRRSKDADDLKLQMSRYFTLINMIDDAVGDMLASLEAKGLLDNTIVVYNTDHGDFAGEHGLVLKNLGIYESIHRIPWIMAGPGIPAGKVHDGMIESVDLYPTLAELAGIVPEEGLDGVSRVDDFKTGKGKDFVIAEFDFYSEPQTRVHAIRDRRFRLVVYDDAPADGELYDLTDDPGELNNRFNDPVLQKEKERLSALISNYRKGSRRIHTPQDDMALWPMLKDTPTWRIHKEAGRWSEPAKE